MRLTRVQVARVALAAMALCAVPAVAGAGTVITTSLVQIGPTSGVCCNLVNVSRKDVEVLIGFRDRNGQNPSGDDFSFMVPAGTAATPCTGGSAADLYCRFELVKGGASSVRASSCVRVFTAAGDGSCTAVETAR